MATGDYVIERERMDRLLSMFSRALDIRATFFDHGDAELPLFDIADRSPYCRRLRRDRQQDARCVVCDRASSLVVPSRWVDDRSYRRASFAGDTPGGAR